MLSVCVWPLVRGEILTLLSSLAFISLMKGVVVDLKLYNGVECVSFCSCLFRAVPCLNRLLWHFLSMLGFFPKQLKVLITT